MKDTTGHYPEDKLLVNKVLKGNSAAFGIIIQHTEKLVANIIFKMINRQEDRKDLVQEVYLKVYRKLPDFKFESKLSTWIARICYNACLDHLRKKQLVLPDDIHWAADDVPDENQPYKTSTTTDEQSMRSVQRKELAGILQSEIELLPPVYKTLITLFHQEELSYDELAGITGMPAGTVKSYLYRARNVLRKSLLSKYAKEDL